MTPAPLQTLPIVGWREYVAFPDFGIDHVKAKIDTGARSSTLHASDVRRFQEDGVERVSFRTRVRRRAGAPGVLCTAAVLDERPVRSSNGSVEVRTFIRVDVRMMEVVFPVELTLTDRDDMRFRVLIGREALRGRFLVDPGRSFLDPSQIRKPSKFKKG